MLDEEEDEEDDDDDNVDAIEGIVLNSTPSYKTQHHLFIKYYFFTSNGLKL